MKLGKRVEFSVFKEIVAVRDTLHDLGMKVVDSNVRRIVTPTTWDNVFDCVSSLSDGIKNIFHYADR